MVSSIIKAIERLFPRDRAFKDSVKDIKYEVSRNTEKWKKVITLRYKDNVLTITTLDHNIKQYRRDGNTNDWVWKQYNSHRIINDEYLINSLDEHYKQVIQGRFTKGQGWVKSLR